MADTAGAGSLLGHTLELEVGSPAAGGSCVARTGGPHGRVVFVRHALPGEQVRAVVTEDRGGSFCRADAIEILQAASERVTPPCPHAGPGRCGGCDWQHASGDAQRELKAGVIRDQFTRLAGLSLSADVFAGVEALPGGLLGWRTRIAYAVGRGGRPGLRQHASHEVEPIETCPLGVAGVGDSDVLAGTWPGRSAVEVVRGSDDRTSVVTHRQPRRENRPHRRGGRRPQRRSSERSELEAGPAEVTYRALGHEFAVAATGFWQVHPHAADTLAAAVLDALGPQPGERVLDLFAGAGMLTAALANAVGEHGAVVGIEGDRRAVTDAGANLEQWPWAQVRHGRVTDTVVAGIGAELPSVDVVVLDPPRAGAGAAVMTALADLAPRAIAYVSCDPATLARDIAALRPLGWELTALRAFDAFPMTHHVECLATLSPAAAPQG